MVLRKVLTILTTDDDGDVGPAMEGYSIVAFLKDVIIGIAMGLATISVLIFLDREFIYHAIFPDLHRVSYFMPL